MAVLSEANLDCTLWKAVSSALRVNQQGNSHERMRVGEHGAGTLGSPSLHGGNCGRWEEADYLHAGFAVCDDSGDAPSDGSMAHSPSKHKERSQDPVSI